MSKKFLNTQARILFNKSADKLTAVEYDAIIKRARACFNRA